MAVSADRAVFGLDAEHLSPLAGEVWLHARVIDPFRQLQAVAAQRGFDLRVASGFRSFDRQLAIWNAKAEGRRPVLDSAGSPLDMARLNDRDKVFAILRWSALPGTSRHHWGTDMDVWDAGAVAPDYRLQLTVDEYSDGGPFAALSDWLASDEVARLGFVRPYDRDRGGVAPEPWHLSYRPVATGCESRLTPQALAPVLADSDMRLRDAVLGHLDDILSRFVHRHGG